MLQIFENKALSDIAKPGGDEECRMGGLSSISAVLAFLLSLALAPTGQYLPTQFTRLLLVAPPPPSPAAASTLGANRRSNLHRDARSTSFEPSPPPASSRRWPFPKADPS